MKCVYKNCGATDKNEPKRTFFVFPRDDDERCQKWIDACGNEELLERYRIEGILNEDDCICGFHFPLPYQTAKKLPENVDPIPCVDLTNMNGSGGSDVKYINAEHSYNKRGNVQNITYEPETVLRRPKVVKKYEAKSIEIIKSVPKMDDHMYFLNLNNAKGNAVDSDAWYRFSVIHQKEPEQRKRKTNFHIFTDTATSRWTSIPHNQKPKYMSKITKHYTIESHVKVTDLSKTVNQDMELCLRDFTNEEETEHWDLHSSDATPNVNVTIKSSSVLPQLGRRFPHNPPKPIPGTSILKSSLQSKKPVRVDNVANFSNEINLPAACKTIYSGFKSAFCETTIKQVYGVPVKITGPFKNNHTVFSRQTLEALGLTPQSQFGDFDFANAEMTYWHYQCENGVVETIVECVSQADKNRVVRIPAKQVIHQLLATNKKSQYLKNACEKKKEKDKLKCREHAKEIRRLRNRIVQLQKEMNAPKAYEKFLNYDQCEAMEKDSMHGHHWKDDTIVLAHNIRLACTTKGYKYLYKKLHWPLPSIKTLRKRAKDLHLPCPEVVRAVLVRKPGEAKKKPAAKPVNGLALSDDSDEEVAKPSVISINPSLGVSSPGLVQKKRVKQVTKRKLKQNTTVDVSQLTNLIYDDENGQQSIVQFNPTITGVRSLKKKNNENPQISEDELAVKKIKIDEEVADNVGFEEIIPEFLDESEVYYKFVRLEDEDLQEDGQIVLNYNDRLQTLANASVIHQSPMKNKRVIGVVQNVNYDNSDLNSNQFQRLFNVTNFDGFSNT